MNIGQRKRRTVQIQSNNTPPGNRLPGHHRRAASAAVARKRHLLSSAAAITAGLLISAHAHAAGPFTYTWTGGGADSNWTTVANWSSPNGGTTVPIAGDTAILGDTTSNRTIIYNTSAAGSLATLTMTQTDPFVNLLDLQRGNGLSVTSNLTLGPTSGTAQIFFDAPLSGQHFGNLTVPLLTLNSGGIMELANDSDGTNLNQDGIAGNVAINSGGILQLDQSVVSVASGTFGITITGSLTMAPRGTLTQGVHAPNPIGFAAAYKAAGGLYSTADRLTVSGNFTLSGGTFINGGTITNGVGSTMLFLSGPSNDITNLLAPSFQSDPTSGTTVRNYSNNTITDSVRMGNSTATLTTDSDLPGGISAIDTNAGSNSYTVSVGSHTPGRLLTVGQIGLSNKNNTGGSPTETFQLTSDITSAFVPSNGSQGVAAGTILAFDTNGHILNVSGAGNATGFSVSGSAIANLTINNSAATTGTIQDTFFNLAFHTGGSSVAANVNLLVSGQATTTGLTNNLGLGGGSGAIDPTSTFTYNGLGTSATPDKLTSNRNIGNLSVTAGYLKLTSAISQGSTATSTPSSLNVAVGTLDLGGFNLASGNVTGVSTGTITNSTGASVFTIGSFDSGNGSFPGVISGGLTLTKTGAGSIGLSGANTYTGGTNINAGTLIARSASALGSGAVSVATGAGLNYIAPSAGAVLSVSNLTLNGGTGTVVGTPIGNAITKDQISVTGTAITSGTVQVNINGTGASSTPSGTYTLIHTVGGSLNTATTYTLGTIYNNTTFTVGTPLTATTTDLTVPITSQTALTTAFWTGGLSGATNVWAASNGTTTSNWSATSGGAAQALVPGSGADVTIPVGSAPTSMVLGADMSIKGLTIADTTNGLGLNADPYTLTVGADGITMNSGVPASTVAANVTASGAETWTNNSANPLTFSGTIGQAGGTPLIIAGTGTIIFSGVDTSQRGITINSGTLKLAGVGTLGTTANGIIMSSGAVLDLNGTSQTISQVTGTGGTILNNNSSTNSTLSFGLSGGTGTFPGNIVDNTSGTGTVAIKEGGRGIIVFSGNNTYSGETIVAGGAGGGLAAGSTTGLSPNSPITLATSTATLDVSGFANTIGGLNFTAGTLKLGLGAAGGNGLTASGNNVINVGSAGVVTLTGTTSPSTIGVYHLLAAPGGLSYNAALPANPDTTNYRFVTTSTNLDLQHIQDQASGLTAASPATINIITGATTPISATLTNTAPVGSAALNVGLSDNGSTGGTVSALSASTGATVASGSPATVSGTFTAGATLGTGLTWSIKNTDNNALTTTATAGGIVNIYTHSTASFTSANNTPDGNPGATVPAAAITSDTINLGTFSQGANSGSESFTLGNILANLGVNAAGLELSSVTPAGGNISQIGLTVPAFTGAASLPGNSIASSFGSATLDTTTSGSFSNTYTLNLEDDQRVVGANAIGSETLTLILNGVISGGGPNNLIWNNAGGSGDGITWDIATNQNWSNGGTPAVFNTGDHVTFNDTNNGHYAVTIAAGGVAPGSVVVSTNNTYTFGGGAIGGSSTLAKSGSGTLVLNNTNTYTGSTSVTGGMLEVGASGSLPSGNNLTIDATSIPAAVKIDARSATGIQPVTLGNVSLVAGGTLTAASVANAGSSANHGNRMVLVANSLANAGNIDLGGNDLIVHSGDLASINNQVKAGFNAGLGYWDGAANGSIRSSAAAADTTFLTALGVAPVSTTGTLGGDSVTAGDVLVKYTYYGDADLSGLVDGGDYTIIDANAGPTGQGTKLWSQGDFNYDGLVDGSDYSLIDNAFNLQGSNSLASPMNMVASNTSEIAGGSAGAAGSAVPEPGSLTLLGIGAIGLLNRRRRK